MPQARPYRLRPLEERDLETVAAFEREIALISFPDDPITDLGFYVKKLRQVPDNANAAGIVAEDDTGLVGWVHASRRQNFITKEAYADLHSIYVSPSQRGTGLVSALLAEVFEFCRSRRLDRIVVRSRAGNEPMKAVMARFGFAPTQIYYEKNLGDGEADLDQTTTSRDRRATRP
jgi:ribosomal protein S18 acetylase RimI-like enzyme